MMEVNDDMVRGRLQFAQLCKNRTKMYRRVDYETALYRTIKYSTLQYSTMQYVSFKFKCS